MSRRTCPSPGVDKETSAGESANAYGRRRRIQFFTIAETAEMLGLAGRTIRRRIAAGELIAHRFGGAVRIAESDLRAFLAIHREG